MKWWEVVKKRQRFLILAVIIIFIALSFLVSSYKNHTNAQPRNDFKELASSKFSEVKSSSVQTSANNTVDKGQGRGYVDVKGAIRNPGVYKINNDGRVETILGLAGGALPEADLIQVNLAQVVKDQQIIYIPRKGEKIPAQFQANHTNNSIQQPSNNSGNVSDESSHVNDIHKVVNLNSATKEDLQTLTGVGERKAEAILQYRQQHGSFKVIEDLKQVDGFGEKTFLKLKPYLAV